MGNEGLLAMVKLPLLSVVVVSSLPSGKFAVINELGDAVPEMLNSLFVLAPKLVIRGDIVGEITTGAELVLLISVLIIVVSPDGWECELVAV